MFRRSREPDPAWVEALARVAPRNEHISWLLLYFEPGETWDPIQRWMIREMDPALQFVDPELLAMYRGPPPRTLGHWEGTGANKRWKGDSLISQRQWTLFQDTQCISRRVWVVQGPNGGHPFEISQAEQAFLKALGAPNADTPAPGALPYADPDARTWRRLREYDRLTKWQHAITWNGRRENKTEAGLWIRRDLQAQYQQFGQAMLDFFTEGLKEAIDGVPRGTLEALYDVAPKTDEQTDYEAVEQRFVEASPVSLRAE